MTSARLYAFRLALVASATLATVAALGLLELDGPSGSRLVAGLLAFLAAWIPRQTYGGPHVGERVPAALQVEPATSTRRTDPPPPRAVRLASHARKGVAVYAFAEIVSAGLMVGG